MDYFEDEGRLFEFTVLSEADSEDSSVECFDMSQDGDFIGTMRVGPSGKGFLTLRAELPASVLRRWLEVAQTQAGLKLDKDD